MDSSLMLSLQLPTKSFTRTTPRVTLPSPPVTVIFVSLSTTKLPPRPPALTATAKSSPPIEIAEASPPNSLNPDPVIIVVSPFLIQRSEILVSTGGVLSIVMF